MLKYDKLKNMETEEKFWDFTCPHCKVDGTKKNIFTVKPIGTSWKPDDVDTDLTINNKRHDKSLENLPTIREAILKTIAKNENTNLLFICNECTRAFTVYENIKVSDVRKWLNKHHPFNMKLGLTENERRKIKERRSRNS